MRRKTHLFLPLLIAAAMMGPGAAAQSLPAPTPAPARTTPQPDAAFLAPKKETKAPASVSAEDSPLRRNRGLSPEIAAQLAAAAPKYSPPPPKPEPKPEETQVDAREIDKPRNGIIRLPSYVVQESKPPVFTERSISTQKGIEDIAMRRYISDADRALNRFSLHLFSGYSLNGGGSTQDRALAMYGEDERLRAMKDVQDSAVTTAKSDTAQGKYILREARNTYMRTSDFGRPSSNPAGMPERAGPR